MTDYLRKRIVTVVFILAAGVCLISCAKTPEKKSLWINQRLIQGKHHPQGKEHPKGSGGSGLLAGNDRKKRWFRCPDGRL